MENENKESSGKLEEQVDYLKKYKRNRIKTIIFSILLIIIALDVLFLSTLGVTINSVIESFIEYASFINIKDFDVEYMYINEVNDEKILNIYMYSKKYKNDKICVEQYTITKQDSGEKELYLLLEKQKEYITGSEGGVEYRISIDKENFERIYIQGRKGGRKEIWNKEMQVMTKEEWIKWYFESYVPDEAKEIFTKEVVEENPNIICYNTKTWRRLYTPKGK